MPTAIIRATTFQIRYRGTLLTSRQWDAEIRRAFRSANEIYGKYNIHFTLSNVTHLSNEASMTLLTQSVRQESSAEGISPDTYFQRERRLSRHTQRTRAGVTGTFDYGGFLLRAFPLNTSEALRRAASREALGILKLNRAPGEIATYWVPGFNSNYYGLTYMSEFNSGISRANEGIVMSYQAGQDILAHEIGHLLMRAGHCTFEGPNGENEGSAPSSNLMHRDNDVRNGGKDLTSGQIQRMLVKGRPYLR